MATPNLTITELDDAGVAADEQARIERQAEVEALTGVENYQDPIAGGELDPDPVRARATEPEPDTTPVVPMSPGDAARAAIANKFKRTDGAPFDGDMTKDENLYGEVARVALEPDPDLPEPGVTATAPARPVAQQPRMITKVVRGKEVTRSEDEWLDIAMKVEAGDSYLQEAQDLLKNTKKVIKDGAGRDSQRPEDADEQDHEPDSDADPAPRRPGDKRQEAITAIQFGEGEDAARALDAYVVETATRVVEEGQFKRLADNDLVKSQNALQKFTAANESLAKNRHAVQLLENEVYGVYREELVGLGLADEVVPRNPSEIAEWARHYRIRGHAVSDADSVLVKARDRILPNLNPAIFATTPAAKPKGDPVIQVDMNRSERRAGIPQQPPARTVAPRQNPTQPAAKQSPSDVIAQMRRDRGQPV